MTDQDIVDIILDCCEFGPPKQLRVAGTPKILRKSTEPPNKDFWNLWREWKDEIRELGFSVGKNDDDEFEIKWWQDASDEQPELETPIQDSGRSVLECYEPLAVAADILRDYQIPAAATNLAALRQHKFALDASDMGLGKTFVACATAANLGMNVGVVCPANVVTKWTDTLIDVFGIDPEFVMSYEKLRTGKTDYVSRVDRTVRRRQQTTFTWHAADDVLLIFDEVHMCANSSSLNARMFRAAIVNPWIRVLALSATSAYSPLRMDDLGLALGLHNGNWWDWALRNGCRPGVFGGLTFNSKDPESRGAKALRQIHATIFPSRGCRLRREELGDALPQDQILVHITDAPDAIPAWMKPYLDAVDQAEDADQLKADEAETEVSAFTQLLRQRQRTELLKLPFIIDNVESDLERGASPAVFLNYAPSIEAFISQLPKDTRYAKLVGGLSPKMRDEVVGRFQSNAAQLIVCQLQAGAASIDLHDLHGGHPRVTYICPNYDAVKLTQALGRCPRNGAKTPVVQNIIFLADAQERHLAANVQAKLNNLALLNDGDLSDVIQVKE